MTQYRLAIEVWNGTAWTIRYSDPSDHSNGLAKERERPTQWGIASHVHTEPETGDIGAWWLEESPDPVWRRARTPEEVKSDREQVRKEIAEGKFAIEVGWLVYLEDKCNCVGGTAEFNGMHEPTCGMTPVMSLLEAITGEP